MPTHALRSDVQLLQCTIATGAPSGVVTISIISDGSESSFSRTIIEKDDVPAETLPVRFLTAFVATIPVPASPSGGQSGVPGCNDPDVSRRAAPSGVRHPASAPAVRGSGSMSVMVHAYPYLETRLSNCAIIVSLYVIFPESIGNMPEASPTPSTFSPVSLQCMYPASVVKKATSFTCASLFNMH